MALISYDVSIDPSNPEVQLGISATPSSVTIEVEEIGDCSISVKPSTGTIVAGALAGAIAGAFGSAVGVATVYAAGALIKTAIEDAIKNGVKGQSQKQDFGHPLGYSVQVEGVDVKVEAETLSLSTYNGMLLLTGTVKVS